MDKTGRRIEDGVSGRIGDRPSNFIPRIVATGTVSSHGDSASGVHRGQAFEFHLSGYWVFPFRLGMTPEITLIELVRG